MLVYGKRGGRRQQRSGKGKGIWDRGPAGLVHSSRFAYGAAVALVPRARWPDLQATASAADPLFLVFCCIALCCVAVVTGWDRFIRKEQRNPTEQRKQRNPTEQRKPTEPSELRIPTEQRLCGFVASCFVALWLCGFAALRLCGFAALWLCGFVALWLCGFMVLRLCGFVALWFCGLVALWLCGFVALWLRGFVASWLCGFAASTEP